MPDPRPAATRPDQETTRDAEFIDVEDVAAERAEAATDQRRAPAAPGDGDESGVGARPGVPSQSGARPGYGGAAPRALEAGTVEHVPGVPHEVGQRWARWRPSLLSGGLTWLSGLIMYAVVTAVSWLPFDSTPGGAGPPDTLAGLLAAWSRWDTTWYLIIADAGYTWDTRATAFFPLYPMLVRAANPWLPGGTFEAALLVSITACLAALVLVHRLTDDLLGPQTARRATFYLLAFPTGFYLMAAYTESLFVALSVGALYCMRRGHWWWAGALAGFASATRMAGAVLAVAFVVEYLRQCGFSPRRRRAADLGRVLGRVRPNVLAVLLAPAGLLMYMWYLQRTFGDSTHFLKSQEAWFRTGFQSPLTTVADVVRLIGDTEPLFGPTNVRNVYNLATALVVLGALVLCLVGPWRLGWDHAYLVLFGAAIILMPLTNPLRSDYPLSSMWRFALECTVVFMLLARLGLRYRAVDRMYLTAALGLQGAMVLTFVQNQFVA